MTNAGMRLLEGIELPDGRRVAPSVAEITAIEIEAVAAERQRIANAVWELPPVWDDLGAVEQMRNDVIAIIGVDPDNK